MLKNQLIKEAQKNSDASFTSVTLSVLFQKIFVR